MKKLSAKLCCALTVALMTVALAICVACGGSGLKKIRFETFGGTEIAAIEAEAGSDIGALLPSDPVRIGYTFGGWYLEENCSGARQTLPATMPEDDVTYYAKWVESNSRLTLETNDGGTLPQTVFEGVPFGVNLTEYLADYRPVGLKEGLTFAGWYYNGRAIADDFTMPAGSLTLTAKYWAQYTAEVCLQGADGVYGGAERVEGRALYGDAFDYAVSVSVPAHFSVDPLHEGSKTATEHLAAGDTFTVYLARDRYSVVYISNEPDGVVAEGGTSSETVYYGGSFTVAENGYILPENYRFAGWALSHDGDVAYAPGARIENAEEGYFLYARWETGYRDAFGGSDYLFLSVAEEDVVYLRRAGLEEKKGTYDPSTFVFTFRSEDETVLDGKLFGTYFYYFRDTLENTYTDLEGKGSVLTIGAHGEAIYLPAPGASEIEGTYSFDPDTGYFSFSGGEETFYFNLFESVDGSEVVFRRQDLEEEGYYATQDGIVLYLDGLGGLEYHYNLDNYVYEFLGNPVLTVYGYYEWNEASGLYLAYTRDATGILFQFVFKFDPDAEIPQIEGYEIDGVAVRDDGFRYEFTDKWGSTDAVLLLDGFGKGTYGGEEGEYEQISWIYVYEDDNGDQFENYILIRFTTEAGDVFYFRLDTAYGEFEIDRLIPAEEVKEGYAFGRFELSDLFLLDVRFNGFIYIFENGEAEVWTEYALLNTGDYAYVLYIDLISTVERDADGVYHFLETRNETTGESYRNAFDFRVDPAAGTASVVLPETHDIATFADGIVVDFTLGTATYNGVPVEYRYTAGYLDFYVFAIEGSYRFFYAESGGRTFREVFPSAMYDIAYAGGAEENFFEARLLFEGEGAYLGLMLDSGLYRFVGVGTLSEVAQDEYDFRLTEHIPELANDELSEYLAFRFKRYAGEDGAVGTFYQQSNALAYENFVSDGYGVFVYTEGSVRKTGTVLMTMGPLIWFETEDGVIILSADENTNTVEEVREDVGFWYEMNANAAIDLNRYLILNGKGTVYFYEYDALEGELSVTTARYARSEGWRSDYLEYTVTPAGETPYHIFLAMFEVGDGSGNTQTLPLYQVQIAHRIGEFEVEGGGSVRSAGYPGEEAVYVDASGVEYRGNMYRVTVRTSTTSHEYTNDANGTVVRFVVYSSGYPTSSEFIFDIVNGKLVMRELPFGDYAAESRGKVDTTRYLRLDGKGNATIHSGYNTTGSGSYEAVSSLEGYVYTGTEDGRSVTFFFRVGSAYENDVTTYTYTRYSASEDNVFVSAEDWSVLELDGFGGATCVDRYGVTYTGTYLVFADGYGYFESGGLNRIFSFDRRQSVFAFVDHSAHLGAYYAQDFRSVVFGEAKLTVDGTEYFYTVSGNTVTTYIYDSASGGYVTGTVALPQGDAYSLNGTDYYRWNGEELVFKNREYGEEIALTFVPDGAAFTASAIFGGYENGYTVEVSYLRGRVSATLVYTSGQMDSLPESYPLTLRYSANGESTFSVVPLGSEGVFRDSRPQKQGTFTVDNRRVGEYRIGNKLEISLPDILDTKGSPLSFQGDYSSVMADDSFYLWEYGMGSRVDVAGEDGVDYRVRFFLDDDDGVFRLNAVTVDKTYAVENVGSVTFTQLWYSEDVLYAGYEQYDLVDISLPGDGVTTVIRTAVADGNRTAILVRQIMNTTTGSYVYEAFVMGMTFGGDGFVSGATFTGKYSYGEVTTANLQYKATFLYSYAESGEIVVHYLLSFAEWETTLDSTISRNADGTFSVRTATRNYTVSVRRGSGSLFSLSVTRQ